jgi:glycosyltransferase involved in cell wall biosynthesis
MLNHKKIAIVYDWLDKWGGVERVLLSFHKIMPEAVFYTSYYDRRQASWAKGLTVRTSLINRFPKIIKSNRLLSLFFYPYAFESFDLSGYDLVISVTSSFAKSVITKPGTKHLCYLLTPTRYFWGQVTDYLPGHLTRLLVSPVLNNFRKWDLIASQRPDKILSISKTVADRCRKYYGRLSEVIYPPFDIDYWQNIKKMGKTAPVFNKKYYLVVSRLEAYKKIELVVKVFNQRPDLNLIVIGQGSLQEKLKKMALPNIRFLSDLTDVQLSGYYEQAEALIMPQEEDFGYTAVEAQYFGCPVIACRKGAVKEIISENKTGILFDDQKEVCLAKTLERYKLMSYNLKHQSRAMARKQVERFSQKKFKQQFLSFI